MIFHSFQYVVFFVALISVYWWLPFRGQNLLLLAASYFFYGFVHPWFLILLTATALIDYFTSNRMALDPARKRFYLGITLVANLGVLCSFKYLDFLSGGHALEIVHWLGFKQMTAQDVAALLPVGLSFYTFQSIAYVMDVYRGEIQPQRKLLDFLLFVSFFPQLVAGPIQRAAFLSGQLTKPRVFDARIARSAVVLILWGYLKKLAIADNAATICNKVFSLDQPSWPVLWAGVFAFAVQIFADFSAYTDIARGSARLLGIDIAQNFNHPYLASSPPDFWRRWHISLSTWFRDYVYIPLGGGRCSQGRVMVNIMLTFLLSGLWHGASWNYLLWGAYHGALLVLWRLWERGPEAWRPDRFWRWPQILLTFGLVNFGWLLFRETDLRMLGKYLSSNPFAASGAEWQTAVYLFTSVLLFALPIIIQTALHPWIERHLHYTDDAPPPWSWALLQGVTAALLIVGIRLLAAPDSSDFIYFQF